MSVDTRCPSCSQALIEVLTARGVVLDRCSSCQGLWFDRGEILHFSSDPDRLDELLGRGLIDARPSERSCPRCETHLEVGGFLDPSLEIDKCASCGGLWLDHGEIDLLRAREAGLSGLGAEAVHSAEKKTVHAMAKLSGLPNLGMRSTMVLVLLYGLLTLFFIAMSEFGFISPGAATIGAIITIFLQFLISPFFLDYFLRWFMRLSWVSKKELPVAMGSFLEDLSKKEGIPFPRVGIIDDGTPNAFTYGHVPGNARLVVTKGLLKVLDENEVNAVVAHEMGHIVHWDMLVMTFASLVPIILYYIYRICLRSGNRSRNSRKNDPTPLIGIVAFILYIITQYIVLFLSRAREYWADEYSARAMKDPAPLASALVKIAYGLAGGQGKSKKGSKKKTPLSAAVGALGIFDGGKAAALAASSATGKGAPGKDKAAMKRAMQWDLWNPWAWFYEISSTHPLPAKRIERLSALSFSMDKKPFLTFDTVQPESYWDEFFVDVFILLLPFVGLGLGALFSLSMMPPSLAIGFERFAPLCLCGLGIGMLGRFVYTYGGGEFLDQSVASLLSVVKVSAVRPIRTKLEGKIIGKGIPGLVWSEDLVLQDKTGYIFLDYEQPIWVFNWLFGLTNDSYVGSEVSATGWYRRAPVPYLELWSLTKNGETHHCYTYYFKLVLALVPIVIGVILL